MPTTFPEYESFDGLGLAEIIQRGELSPYEVLEAAIERIECFNPKLNAVIYKMYDEAYERIQNNLPAGLFRGVPILLKDLLAEYAGVPISYGNRFTHNHHWKSSVDSEVVKRLKEAGLVMVGKTNVPEFGLSAVTEPELFGPTHNPWDLDHSPGGSSGGSAAAVSARMVPIAHGGDGGGSLRIPAAYTGIFGFKPSRGRTPVGPLFMRVWQGMVVDHALTRTVRDSAALLDVLAGPELGSPISLPKSDTSFLNLLNKPVNSLRLALIDQPFFTANVDPEYSEALKSAAQRCVDLGHHVEKVSLQISNDIAFAFLIIMMAETTAGVKELSKAIGKKPKSTELERQTAVLYHAGEEFTAADYAWAVQKLDQTSRQLTDFFEKYDAMLTLTMPFPAPKIGSNKLSQHEKVILRLLQHLSYGNTLKQFLRHASMRNFSFMSFTALFNIGGQPAMSVPLCWDKRGMPIGIQFAGKFKHDGMLLQLAKQLEEAYPWDDKRPPLLKY